MGRTSRLCQLSFLSVETREGKSTAPVIEAPAISPVSCDEVWSVCVRLAWEALPVKKIGRNRLPPTPLTLARCPTPRVDPTYAPGRRASCGGGRRRRHGTRAPRGGVG